MAKGKRGGKRGSGTESTSGGGVEIKDIENSKLKTTLQDIVGDIMKGKTYSYSRSQKDGKIIEKNTDIGDTFTHGESSYTKIGANQWKNVVTDNEPSESDGMARILAGLSQLPGTWKYKKK